MRRCKIITHAILIVTLTGALITSLMAQPGTFKGKPILEGSWRGEQTKYVAGEIVVMFQNSNIDGNSYAQRVNGTLTRGVEEDGFAIIEVDVDANVFALCEELYGDPMVKWAEPNFILTIDEWIPNDPYYNDSTQWSLKNLEGNEANGVPDADIDAGLAWDLTRGDADVVLAILDTGIDIDTTTMTLRHYDLNLAGKIILGDDCIGDGYGVADLHGHGSHVAGIASAETNNGYGVAGVAEDCKILVIQVFDRYGDATTTSVRDGINCAIDYQNAHPSERVIMNLSGSGTVYNANTYSALETAETADMPFVTTSGNDYNSTCNYPCQHSSDLENVICVGATTPWDNHADYSNRCNDVDVVAPGGENDYWNPQWDVYSCVPPNSYDYKAGTSMAAPHITGICGLVVSLNMSISCLELRNLIQNTADDEVGWSTQDVQGYDNYHGYGRANAWSAVMHSPALSTPYLYSDERCSNTYTFSSMSRHYRLAPPPNGRWEVAATRPSSSVNVNINWIDTNGITVLASSSYIGDAVDFVLAHGRPSSGYDQYAKVYNVSSVGKFAVEYQQAEEPSIESMFHYSFDWKSAHLVEIYDLYLKNGHTYNLEASPYGTVIDIGIALLGPASPGASYTRRSDALILEDTGGPGFQESDTITVTTGTGYYAFVVYSTNGRNADINIGCRELLFNDTPHRVSEVDGIEVDDGYYIKTIRTGTTMGVIGLLPNSGNNYNVELYEYDYYNGYGSYLVRSGYTFSSMDFILYDQATVSPRNYYPLIDLVSTGGDSTGYVVHAEDDDDVIVSGSNGPFHFYDSAIIHAWDLEMTDGVEYEIVADIVSGTPDIGIALFRKDDEYKSRSQYIVQDYSSGPGSDEDIVWTCDSTGFYTLVAWSQNTDSGTYYIDYHLNPPNLETIVPPGWDYKFVPRDAYGAAYNNCHISATLPGNTADTYLNFCAYNEGGNPVPAITFYNQLYLDGEFFFERPWSTGLGGGLTLYHLNHLGTDSIRGGKHTIELRLDGTDTIEESDENDNSAFLQFIWSPYVLTNDVPVTRDPAPPASYRFPQPNCDGFQYTRTDAYAYGVAICPVTSDDYELRLYDDYTGSEEGFDSLRAHTHYISGYVDYAIATYDDVEPTAYAGVYHHLTTPGNNNFVIHAIDANDRILSSSDETRRDTLEANKIINVYEAQLTAGIEYLISTTGVSGSADVHLYLYGPAYGYYGRGNYVAASYNIGTMDEEILYTPTSTSYHVIVVTKPNYQSLQEQAVYDISVGLAPPNLTAQTPSGWDYPIVPRNIAGATPSSCTLTDTLPGNSNDTYLNFCSYNEGTTAIPSSYWDCIFVDSIAYYNVSIPSGQPAGVYAYLNDRLCSNDIKGGRHTLGLLIDRNDNVVESDETDNWYERQFVWTPYTLSDYTPVTRTTPPRYGNGIYPNCDGFEFTSTWWGAVGILSHVLTENYDIRLFDPWINSEQGFGNQLTASNYAAGYVDFVIVTDQYGGSETYNAGVVQSLYNPGTNSFTIQQANEYDTWYTPGTFGPFSIPNGQILGVWEVNLDPAGSYFFEVDVVSGTADLGTSIYSMENATQSRGNYFPGGYSNSAPGGGDESFTINNPYSDWYYGWTVWKVSSVDLNLSSTFYLTWGPVSSVEPMPVNDLVIERIGSTDARLTWSQVTEDINGNPLSVDYYRIHRNLDANFTPSPVDSIGYTTPPDTTFDDVNVVWLNQKYFYSVIAVDTDGVDASEPSKEESPHIITRYPPRHHIPESVRTRH